MKRRAILVTEGAVDVNGMRHERGAMILLDKGEHAVLSAGTSARAMLLGGAPLDGPRHVWWNFVSSSRERIDRAKSEWQAMRLGTIPGDDKEFIRCRPSGPHPYRSFNERMSSDSAQEIPFAAISGASRRMRP